MNTQIPTILAQMRALMQNNNYSDRTETAYLDWINRYLNFHTNRHPVKMGLPEIEAFLIHLAVDLNVSGSTQNQALHALIFLYQQVLQIDLGERLYTLRAKTAKRLPGVMSRQEVQCVLDQLSGMYRIMATLLYGAGLQVMECVRLRVMDLDFAQHQIVVRGRHGSVDRLTIFPNSVRKPLNQQLRSAKALYQNDVENGYGWVERPVRPLPHPGQGEQNGSPDHYHTQKIRITRAWDWQYVFPSKKLSSVAQSDHIGRRHADATGLHKAVKRAVTAAGLTKLISCRTLRHSFATHLLEAGYNIRIVQELLGHKDVQSTLIYTHVLNKGGMAVRSPLD